MTTKPADPGRRRFTLADAMILIAATAVGLALTRLNLEVLKTGPAGRIRPIRSIGELMEMLPQLAVASLPGAAMISLALGLIRLRRPRPSIRRIARQPGALACLAAVASAVGLPLLMYLACLAAPRRVPGGDWPLVIVLILPMQVGCSVAGAWLALAARRSWRPEPSWIDRAGRLLGLYWIALIPAGLWVILIY